MAASHGLDTHDLQVSPDLRNSYERFKWFEIWWINDYV